MNRRVWTHGLLGGALALSLGCSTFMSSVVDRAASRSGDAVGDQVGGAAGNQMGSQIAASSNPMMAQSMTRMMFTYAFNGVGGYAVNETAYEPGQYTRWNLPRDNNEKPITFERAYLAKDANGNQWWKVKMSVPPSGDAQTAQEQTLIYEAMFSPDGSRLLRLRSKMPGDQEAKEMPVEENTYGFQPPHHLTKESLAAADKGVESVSVPAGTFDAHRLEFGGYAGSAEFWQSTQVPGGTVKYGQKADDGAGGHGSWMAELVAYGNDAKSELGSF